MVSGRRTLFQILAIVTLSMSGCVGLVANLIHAGVGNLVPARFDRLAGSKIAVVCMSSNSSFGNSTAAKEIATRVERKLLDRVPLVVVIDQQQVEDWMDRNDWNEIDYRELADGIGADYLVAVDLNSFSLHEGQTLYKGRADVGLSVHHAESGQIVYNVDSVEIQYPVNGGQHSADTTEASFRQRFLEIISSRVARHFYPYDMKEDYGRDPTLVGV